MDEIATLDVFANGLKNIMVIQHTGTTPKFIKSPSKILILSSVDCGITYFDDEVMKGTLASRAPGSMEHITNMDMGGRKK
jgi:hypothetical protein